jgi:triacylglycerol lipase
MSSTNPQMHSISLEKNSAAFLNPCFKSKSLFAVLTLAVVLFILLPFGLGAKLPAVCKKEIPAITFKNLSPPYKDYAYFQHHQFFPFEYRASEFSLINAWWLAEASTLVYANEAFVKQRFSEAGFKRVKFFNRSGTQCFIAANNQFAIVAFRGSEIWKRNERFDPGQAIADFKTNIDIRLSDWIRGGRVHSGFKAALDDVWQELLPEIQILEARGTKIWLTGHSLGAALATLAADRLLDVQGLYTFGSPRVGDQEFQSRFQLKAFRVVNGNDIVTSMPAKNPYHHVGELKFIDPKGGIKDRPGFVEESEATPCMDASNATESGKENQKFDSSVFIPSWIRNHVPLLYSILLWNEVVVKTEIP